MKILTKKNAAQLQGQIALITGTRQSIELHKTHLKSFQENPSEYKEGIKECQKHLRELKHRKQYLDRGLSFILGDLKNISGGVKIIIADKKKTV